MLTRRIEWYARGAFVLLLTLSCISPGWAQLSSPPSGNCHVTDGTFTKCPDGTTEWSDVKPIYFPASNSYLYVNQDTGHTFLYLMYDFPFRTSPLGASDSVHISFDTVEQESESGTATLEEYDVYISGNGQFQVLEQGQPTPAGKIIAAAGFGTSPNSSTPHLTAELQVPLAQGPPSVYSPDPLFWSADVPPTPPPPPDPPTCPDPVGCNKPQAQINAWTQAEDAADLEVIALGYAAVAVCGPLTVGAAVCGIAFAGWIAAEALLSKDYAILIRDPNDPNFTVVATPQPVTVPGFPTTTATGLSSQAVSHLNALVSTEEQIISLLQVIPTSVNRANGAAAAGNAFWATQQAQAARQYASQTIPLLNSRASLYAALASDFEASGTVFTFSGNDILNTLNSIRLGGLPAAVTSDLTQLGLNSAEQAAVVQVMLSTSPAAVAALGVGRFPQALSDPSFITANNAAVAAFGELSAAPPSNSLTPSLSTTIAGDYTAAGVGLRGETAGTINLSGIPSNAAVVRALLYWGMLDDGLESSLGQLSLNGTAINGTLIGSGPDTCWGDNNSFTFRADVTPFVTGNGAYDLTNVASGGAILAEGASLVVIYQAPGAQTKTVMLADGNVVFPAVSVATTSFTGFTATAPVSATTSFMVGDGQFPQAPQTPVSFTGSLGTLNFPNLFGSNVGAYWDTDTFNVSSVVGSGSSSGSATITLAGDCLLWSAQAFSVATAPVTPARVTATAAVVEAGANANTVVNLRGLAPTDAPTIQNQIAMVVQFRTIQNPSISASDLTSQLVNGLVNDGVISSDQASAIQTAVTQEVVKPVGQPAISGRLVSHNVQSAGVVEVDVQLTNTGTGNARNVELALPVPRSLGGTGFISLNTGLSGNFPLSVGNLAVGASTVAKFFFNVSSTVTKFSVTENGAVQDTLGRPFNFSTSQVVF